MSYYSKLQYETFTNTYSLYINYLLARWRSAHRAGQSGWSGPVQRIHHSSAESDWVQWDETLLQDKNKNVDSLLLTSHVDIEHT